jgi:hypothetical protein
MVIGYSVTILSQTFVRVLLEPWKMRASEIRGLTWSLVDFFGKRLTMASPRRQQGRGASFR